MAKLFESLKSSKKQLDTSLAITWAFADKICFESQDPDGMHMEGFVHS